MSASEEQEGLPNGWRVAKRGDNFTIWTKPESDTDLFGSATQLSAVKRGETWIVIRTILDSEGNRKSVDRVAEDLDSRRNAFQAARNHMQENPIEGGRAAEARGRIRERRQQARRRLQQRRRQVRRRRDELGDNRAVSRAARAVSAIRGGMDRLKAMEQKGGQASVIDESFIDSRFGMDSSVGAIRGFEEASGIDGDVDSEVEGLEVGLGNIKQFEADAGLRVPGDLGVENIREFEMVTGVREEAGDGEERGGVGGLESGLREIRDFEGRLE